MDRNFFPYDFTASLYSQNLIPSPYYPVPPTGAPAATIQAPTQETSTESAVEGQSRQKWSFEDEQYLLQVWPDHLERVKSTQSRKAREEIIRMVNEKRGLEKTVEQCQTSEGAVPRAKGLESQAKRRKHPKKPALRSPGFYLWMPRRYEFQQRRADGFDRQQLFNAKRMKSNSVVNQWL